MLTIQNAQAIISSTLDNLQIIKEPKTLYEPIDYILRLEGKRLRPSLVLLACNIFDHKIDKAINPAIALEVFHNFTLIHDDLMDQAALRRGHKTIHKKWNPNVAILSGDAMLIKAYELLIKTDKKHINTIISLFNQTALKVCEGQQYDMNFETMDGITESEYINMISLKTAALIAGSLKIGAVLGNASEQQQQLIENFGESLGIAFQLQDDLLDVYGDESTFGKEIGGDIVSNKKTYLLIKALSLSKEKKDKRLEKLIKDKNIIAKEKIKLVINIYNNYNIREHTIEQIKSYTAKALQSLDQMKIEDKTKEPMLILVKKLEDRMV